MRITKTTHSRLLVLKSFKMIDFAHFLIQTMGRGIPLWLTLWYEEKKQDSKSHLAEEDDENDTTPFFTPLCKRMH